MCVYTVLPLCLVLIFFFQAEDGIRDLVRSRGLGDVYKRQPLLIQPGIADSGLCLLMAYSGMDSSSGRDCMVDGLSLIHI